MMDSIKVKISTNLKYGKYAKIPTRGTEKSCAYDVYSAEDCIIKKKDSTMIELGLCMQPEEGYWIKFYERSSMALKNLQVLAGVIDEDYTGPIRVIMFNNSNVDYNVKIHDRIAQFVIYKRYDVNFIKVESLDKTERGASGYGSTGR